jgi:hypothetical protein
VEGKPKPKPSLSILALIAFIVSFVIARAFTTFNPHTIILINGSIHIHHFWYGLVMLAIGGWLGISFEEKRINRLAAILFGAGGGLIGDEVGLLLTLGDYWTMLTYTFLIVFLAFASILILLNKYFGTIRREFTEFLSSNISLYIGVFMAAVSIAFIMETDDVTINTVSTAFVIIAFVIILMYFVQRIRKKR